MAKKKLSRRDTIKLLGAALGGAVLANTPSKWNTPRVISGVLPAHAQSSALLYLSAGYAEWIDTSESTGEATGIWAFVSDTAPLPGNQDRIRPGVGVGNISVTLSHLDKEGNTVWPDLPVTMKTISSGPDIGFVRFPDQTYTFQGTYWNV